jgi:hypothetical protein
MQTNPYFHCKDTYMLFRDAFMDYAQNVTGKHMGQGAVDTVLRNSLGFRDKAAFEKTLKQQPSLGEHAPLFDSYTWLEAFCHNVSGYSRDRWKLTKAQVTDFVASYMGYLCTSDCLVDLSRMESALPKTQQVVEPEEAQEPSLFRTVDQFREESQNLSNQLNSIKHSALRLAMAKAQGFNDTRAFEEHLENFGSCAARPVLNQSDAHAYNPHIFVTKRHGYLSLQGPALSADRKASKHMACWDDMMRHWLRQLNTDLCEIQPTEIDGNTYIEAHVHLEDVPVAQLHKLSAILANFYYSYRDRWEAGVLCHRFSNAIFDYTIDTESENYRRFAFNLEAVWNGEELEDVIFMDDELPVDVFGVKDTVKQARRVFGDYRMEDVKRAVRWRLAEDINERAEEYHACETLMNTTLTHMEEAVIERLKRNHNDSERPDELELPLWVVEDKAAIYQAMLMSFLLGNAITAHH